MNNLFFSIIVPVYNTERELKRCIESVTVQSFRDYEVLLIDDGSTDGSGELCDVIEKKDNRFHVFHQSNQGSSAARNKGIMHAKGQYVLFLDSDDCWSDSSALSKISEIIMKTPNIDVITSGVSLFYENGDLFKNRFVEKQEGIDKFSVLKPLVYKNQWFSAIYVKVLRREFLIENNILFPKGYISGEDIEFTAKVMVLCKYIYIYDEIFYKRIIRKSGSITSSIGKKNITDILSVIERGIDFINNQTENLEERNLYYEYWAYQYAMLLGLAAKISGDPDFDNIYERLKKLKWLLQFDHVKKVRMMKYAVRTFGLKGAMKLLSVYYERKR